MKNKTKQIFKKWGRIVSISFITFFLSYVLLYDIGSIDYFAPIQKTTDFQMSDFYNIVAHNRQISELDTNIVVINVDYCTTPEIAEVLDAVDYCEPKAVALDLLFANAYPDDSLKLVTAVGNCRNLILPQQLSYNIESDSFTKIRGSYLDDTFADSPHASVNLAEDKLHKTVRYFRPNFPLESGDSINSLAVEVVKAYRPEALQLLYKRNKITEPINYNQCIIDTIRPSEILISEDLIKGKIVLIGTINEAMDLHQTPISDEYPGIMIHASAIATILHNCYLDEADDVWNWITAFFATMFVLWLWATFQIKVRTLLLRFVQVALLYAIIHIGYYMFVEHRIIINLTRPLAMVALAGLATDVWLVLLFCYNHTTQFTVKVISSITSVLTKTKA